MNLFDVLKRPVLSEKSNALRERNRQYVFEVHPKANKGDIKRAVATVFDVKVEKVQTMVTRGKVKRRGMRLTKLTNTKRAFITLVEGAKIDIFKDLD